MNIFYLSEDPVQAAQWMVDRHVVKMVLESAQLLSTAHRVLDGVKTIYEIDVISNGSFSKTKVKTKYVLHDAREDVLYKETHINHPSAIWCRTSVENYNWLADHLHALLQEYTYRYGKKHKVDGDLSYMLMSPPKNLQEYDMTTMPSAMADEYKISDDPIINYRNYYKYGKASLHSWKNRQQPEWI